MQCPFCASELSSDAADCASCGAIQVTRRTPLGVVAGGLSVVFMVLVGMLWIPVFVLPFTVRGLVGYPWWALGIGSVLVAGLLWYSRSSRRARWVRIRD